MRRSVQSALVALALVAIAAPSLGGLLGDPGDKCKTNNDCNLGLRCVADRCVDPRAGAQCKSEIDCGGRPCVAGKCQAAQASPSSPSSSSTATSAAPETTAEQTPSKPFEMGGVHVFAGMTWLAGPALGGRLDSRGTWDSAPEGSFLFALRGGLLIGHHEIAVEVSPMTYMFYNRIDGTQFQVNGTFGHLFPLIETPKAGLYYPIRGGVGTIFGNISNNAYFVTRADLVGLAVRIGHVFAELHAPSFRWAIYSANGATPNVFSWEMGLSLSYAL